VGINARTMRFLDVFLLHCLQSESPPDTPQEITELARNQHLTAARGREPGLQLLRGGQAVTLKDWGSELVQACEPIARALDAAHGCTDYSAALASARAGLDHPSLLPSARVLAEMASGHDNSFLRFVRARSQQTREHLLARPWTPQQQLRYELMARKSLEDQKAIEAADTMPFEIFRQQYVSPARLGLPSRAATQEVLA
jgi:glutamate--cysteine ligase